MKLEIACFNYESAVVASRSGADRIELCAGFEVGGTTPDFKLLQELKAQVSIPIYVMVRPRGGDFAYSGREYEQMKSTVRQFRDLADGFVFGILTPDSKVDVTRNSELIKIASKPCTFHRAFDEVDAFGLGLQDVISCGFSNILTSAGKGNAVDNLDALSELVRNSDGKITIMPGGGVRSSNIEKLRTCGAVWFHSAAITSAGQVVEADEIAKMKAKALFARDIERRLLSDFRNESPAAATLLFEAMKAHEPLFSNRILRCIIFLSQGNIQKLKMSIGDAIADPRDVTLWAEYVDIANEPKRVRNFENSFESSEIS